MKIIYRLSILLFLILINLTNPKEVKAQFDTPCPILTTPFETLTTRNPQTGNRQANGCLDNTGRLQNLLAPGTFTNPSIMWTNCFTLGITCGFFLDSGGFIGLGSSLLGNQISFSAGGDINFANRNFPALAFWDSTNLNTVGDYTTIAVRWGTDLNTCTSIARCAYISQIGDLDPQQYTLYNTTTNNSNFERLRLGWNANVALIRTENAGSGTLRPLHLIGANCVSTVGTCGAHTTGFVTIAAAGTTVTVSSTEVTASSVIRIQFDESIGGTLGVTCNTAAASESAGYFISSRIAGTSFTIKTSSSPAVNPACLSFSIVN